MEQLFFRLKKTGDGRLDDPDSFAVT